MTPNLFIPGAPKCGTTALVEYLSTHPSVFVGHIKEPNFWSTDMPFFARREGLSSEMDYLAIFGHAPATAKFAVDASTHYLYSDIAVARVCERFPDARYVVCVRPHAELAHAWHMQMVNSGYEDITDFGSAWRLIERRRCGDAIPRACPEPKLLDYEAIAKVGQQLGRLLQVAGEHRVHLVFLDDMKSDARQCYLGVLNFLGLEDDGRTDFQPSNPAYRNRSAMLSRLIRHPRLRPIANKALSLIDPQATRRIKSAVKSALYAPAKRAPVDPSLQADLAMRFDDDKRLLQRLTGRQL